MDQGWMELDPSSAARASEVRELLRMRRLRHPEGLRAFATRVLEENPDDGLRLDARTFLASAAVTEGDDREAERLFRAVLEECWGSGDHFERVACVNLAMILTRQRRLVEAFAVSRRACRLLLETGETLGIFLSHAQLAKTLLQLGDLAGFADAVGVVERHRPEIDDTLRGWIPQLLAGLQAELALQRGDFASADRLMAEATEAIDCPAEVAQMAWAVHDRRVGRPAQALLEIRRALAGDFADSGYRLRFQAEELLCLIDLGDAKALLGRAHGCLADLVANPRACGTPIWRMRVGETLAAALVALGRHREEARLALEIAAAAALERSWESRLFFQDFPQLERLEPADLALLEAHGERFRAEHLELLGALRELLCEPRGGSAARLVAEGGDAPFVAICAWCKRVRGPERTWLPLDDFRVPADASNVTHGICRSCNADMTALRRQAAVAGRPR